MGRVVRSIRGVIGLRTGQTRAQDAAVRRAAEQARAQTVAQREAAEKNAKIKKEQVRLAQIESNKNAEAASSLRARQARRRKGGRRGLLQFLSSGSTGVERGLSRLLGGGR